MTISSMANFGWTSKFQFRLLSSRVTNNGASSSREKGRNDGASQPIDFRAKTRDKGASSLQDEACDGSDDDGVAKKKEKHNIWSRGRTPRPRLSHLPEWGLCEYDIVHTILSSSPVILWIELGGNPKWLPLNSGYHDVMHTRPIKKEKETLK